MVKSSWLKRLPIILMVLLTNSSFGWGECELKITFPENPALDCSEENVVYDIEAEILSDQPLNGAVDCNWGNRYEELTPMGREGNICKARIIVDKPEPYWITVTYQASFEEGSPLTKKCKKTEKLDIKPTCCLAL